MIDINKLRRRAQAALAWPDGISLNWIKLLQDFQQSANPAAITALLDRLEAAEKERDWHAERCEDAMNECDALRAELSKQQTLTVAAQHIAEVAQSRANQLRARIKEREKQEPVAWCATDETGTVIEAQQAQPAPSMPDLLESLRCACNYIDKLGGFSKQYRVMLASAPEAKP